MINIGPVLAERLRAAGIESEGRLRELGALAAWELIADQVPDDACTHTLLALEGAVRGVRWTEIPKPERDALAAQAHRTG